MEYFFEYIHFFLAFLLIASGIYIFISNNPVHSVLSLILSFCVASLILLMLEAEFIALLFIMVYVGAVAVLFLFIVMMINLKKLPQKKVSNTTTTALIFLSPLVLLKLRSLTDMFFTDKTYYKYDPDFKAEHFPTLVDGLSNIQVIGQALFNGYTSAVLLAGFILLIALIGSICLTIDFKNSKEMDDTYDQLSRKNRVVHKF